MLRLLHPVVAEQALELRIEILVVLDAVEVVRLRHPLEVQGQQRDAEPAVREHDLRDLGRGADHAARRVEARLELLGEPVEQVDVLRLLVGERHQRAHLDGSPPGIAARASSSTNGRMNSSTKPNRYR